MTPREMNAQEVVRWLNELEGRCRRLRWIAATSLLLALAALLLPALPRRLSPWLRERVDALEVRSAERPNTGRFALGVQEGSDPRFTLSSRSLYAHAILDIEQGTPTLDLYDEGGQHARLRIAPRAHWGPAVAPGGPRAPEDRTFGLSVKGAGGRVDLGGDDALTTIEMAGPDQGKSHGSMRLWSGHREPPSAPKLEPNPEEHLRREPGTALVLLDQADRPRVEVTLLVAKRNDDGEKDEASKDDDAAPSPEPDVVPSVTLRDRSGRERARLRLEPRPVEARRDPPTEEADALPSFALLDQMGRERIVLRLGETGEPTIRLLDERGRVLWRAP